MREKVKAGEEERPSPMIFTLYEVEGSEGGCAEEKVELRSGEDRLEGTAAIAEGQEAGETSPSPVVLEHRRLWAMLRRFFEESLEKRDGDRLKLAKGTADALASIVKGDREAWGIEESPGGSETGVMEELHREMEQIFLPPGAGKALEGAKEVCGSNGGEKVGQD